jgi:hypothetical protein
MVNDDAQNRDKENADLNRFGWLLNLVGKLVGDQQNLKFDVQDLKLNLGGTKVTVNGKVNLNFVYSEEVEKANVK